jgi:hypothetical protein
MGVDVTAVRCKVSWLIVRRALPVDLALLPAGRSWIVERRQCILPDRSRSVNRAP